MPSVLSDNDKETVKRTVPKPTNKIQAVAVARLYVAYPDRQRWSYTGLQGAVVLANDLVGNTYWIKMVDVSVCVITRGAMGCLPKPPLTPCRLLIAELYGTKKSTIPSITTKTEPSFILSNSNTV